MDDPLPLGPMHDPQPNEIECGMCHQRVPATQTQMLGCRVLCFGCLSGWFEEDDDPENERS